ncbi:MAG: polysaccharide pyruvyl transferase family protein [Nitrospira sp. LK70]|nr:polysaccharide pyruvyl transferase family protein [Nitrospira sp. LK70]
MMIGSKVTLFDPSLWTNEGEQSINLGDVIIHEAVEKSLKNIFSKAEFIRISSHRIPPDSLLKAARRSAFMFFGGTNVLSSDLRKYNQWKLPIPSRLAWPFRFPVNGVILMGVGWWQYQDSPTPYTRAFYSRALSHQYAHSVRDSYTEQKMRQLGFNNVINTGCPTMWVLNGLNVATRRGSAENCLFTLTDYLKSPTDDDRIIGEILAGYRGKVYFFPQGNMDREYIACLGNYQKYSSRITILNRSFRDYVATLMENDVDYIGTRLHAGIKALQMGKNALIISIDNRAAEISSDTGLPVISRDENKKISWWIDGKTLFDKIRMPVKEIDRWKRQFLPC